jgi:hypothetical protein
MVDRGVAMRHLLLRLASPGVLPSVAIRAVVLERMSYGSMSLEAASFWGKKCHRRGEFKALGLDVPPPFVGGRPESINPSYGPGTR